MKHDSIIVFGEDFGRHPSSTQHLIQELSSYYKVIWINSIGLRKPKLNLYDFIRIIKKIYISLFSKCTKNQKNIKYNNIDIINPKAIPVPTTRIARAINKYLLHNLVIDIINNNNLKNPILWLSLPTAIDAVIDHNIQVLYYCCDDFESLSGVDNLLVSKFEQECIKRANYIIASSKILMNKFPTSKTYLIEHGVGKEFFSSQRIKLDDMPNNNQPNILFYGSLEEWIDLELIYFSAQKLHNFNFIIIGKGSANISKILTLDNVYYLKYKLHNELPSYLQNADVLLIPFINNLQINACNPLKLREYLASGKPIISTNFPSISKYQDLIYIANNKYEFVHMICKAHHDQDKYKAKQRMIMVANETWENKAIAIRDIIN